MYSKVVHFLKKKKFAKVCKSPFYSVKILKFYGTKGSMVIKSILIGACLHIPNIYTFKKFKIEKKNYVNNLSKYVSILTIKSFIKIRL
jgi:hypothetical protein